MNQPAEIGDDQFQSEVLKAPGIVLVFFWASWCAPCKMLNPLLEEIAQDPELTVRVLRLDIAQHRRVFEESKLQNIPALRLFVNGQYHSQKIGPIPRFVLRRWLAEAAAQSAESEPL